MEATRELGLKMFNNTTIQNEYTTLYGRTFVDQCLTLAVTVIPSKTTNKRKSANGYRHKFNLHKRKKAKLG